MSKIAIFLDLDDTTTKEMLKGKREDYDDAKFQSILKKGAARAIQATLGADHYVVIVTNNKKTQLIQDCLKSNGINEKQLNDIKIKNPQKGEKCESAANAEFKFEQIQKFIVEHKDIEEAYFFDDTAENYKDVRKAAGDGILVDNNRKIKLASIWAAVFEKCDLLLMTQNDQEKIKKDTLELENARKQNTPILIKTQDKSGQKKIIVYGDPNGDGKWELTPINPNDIDLTKLPFDKGIIKRNDFLFSATETSTLKRCHSFFENQSLVREFSDHFTCILNIINGENEPLTERGQKWLQDQFLEAVNFNDVAAANFCLRNGADCKAASPEGMLPIYIAAKNGYTKMVEFLKPRYGELSEEVAKKIEEYSIEFNTKQEEEEIARKEAAKQAEADEEENSFSRIFDKIKELVSDKNEANVEAAKELLKQYIDITDEDGNTFLHKAVDGNEEDVVIFLLENGANPFASNQEGKTPAILASSDETNEGIQKAFKPKQPLPIPVLDQNKISFSIIWDTFMNLVSNNDEAYIEAAKELLNKHIDIRDEVGNTLLHKAVNEDLEGVVIFLLENGANPEGANHDGATPADLCGENTKEGIKRAFDQKQLQHYADLKHDRDLHLRRQPPQIPVKVQDEIRLEEKLDNPPDSSLDDNEDDNWYLKEASVLKNELNQLSLENIIERIKGWKFPNNLVRQFPSEELKLSDKFSAVIKASDDESKKPLTETERAKQKSAIIDTLSVMCHIATINTQVKNLADLDYKFLHTQVKSYKQTILSLSLPEKLAVACCALAGALIGGVIGLFSGGIAGSFVPVAGNIVGGAAGAGAGAAAGAIVGTMCAIGFLKRQTPTKERVAFANAAEAYIKAVENEHKPSSSFVSSITNYFKKGVLSKKAEEAEEAAEDQIEERIIFDAP